jgi:hypothetical protein
MRRSVVNVLSCCMFGVPRVESYPGPAAYGGTFGLSHCDDNIFKEGLNGCKINCMNVISYECTLVHNMNERRKNNYKKSDTETTNL